MKLILGDCLEELKKIENNSIDGCITDPPAGINFMNKEWDKDKGGRDQWMKWMQDVFSEVLRVLKPGAHALVWALPRTSHWTAMSLENSGFEVRDCVYHIFGQGFPKSSNISKNIDKKFGAERKVIGKRPTKAMDFRPPNKDVNSYFQSEITSQPYIELNITAPSTDLAKKYDGYGTQLKPAVECWWLIRKPFKGSIVDNVLKYGTGGLNIDKSRIPTEDKMQRNPSPDNSYYGNINDYRKDEWKQNNIGRFPANCIHDGSLDIPEARYFYCSKTSTAERNTGLEDREPVGYRSRGYDGGRNPEEMRNEKYVHYVKNIHPTVKPVKLMSYLINLIMPPTGVVLDPFLGSGSTGIAALLSNYDFIGIEKEQEYLDIANARISKFEDYRRFLK